MQSSESGYNTRYPREPNGITDPAYSIEVGVQTLVACLSEAQVENPIDMARIKLAAAMAITMETALSRGQ